VSLRYGPDLYSQIAAASYKELYHQWMINITLIKTVTYCWNSSSEISIAGLMSSWTMTVSSFWRLWCHSLRAHYICIVAVQHCHSGKIDLLILSKLVAVEKSVFTSSHVLLQYNSSIFWGAMKRYLRGHCDYTYTACRKTVWIWMPWILLMCFPVRNWSIGWYNGWMFTGMGRVQYR